MVETQESLLENKTDIPYAAEVQRKTIHLAAILIPVFVLWQGAEAALMFLIPLALIGLAADVVRARYAWFNKFIIATFGFMMRSQELPPVGGRIVLNGATWVFISAAVTFAIFPVSVALAAFALLILGDTAAAMIGRRLGRTPIRNTGKTWEGSAAFVATGVIMSLFLPDIPVLVGFGGAIVGAVAEAVPRPLNDNIRVPLAAGTAMVLLRMLV